MMTDEEFRRLQAEIEGGPPPPPPDFDTPMSDEEFRALEAQMEPSAPTRAAQNQPAGQNQTSAFLDDLMAQEPPPPQATTGQNLRYAAGGIPEGYAEAVDSDFYAGQAVDAAAEYIPDEVGRAFRNISPVTAGFIDSFRARARNQGQTTDREGLRQAKEFLAPEFEGVEKSPWAEAGRTGLSWAAGAPVKGLKLFTEGMQALPRVAREVTPDVAAGAGAAGGEAAINYLSPEYSWIGELGGGLSGLAIAIATGNTGGLSSNQEVVLRALDDIYDDPEQALAELRRRTDAGEIGTIGDLTREDGVFDVENWSSKATPQGRRLARATGRERTAQIYEDVTAPMRPPEGVTSTQAPYRANLAIEGELSSARDATRRAAAELESEATTANTTARQAQTDAEQAATAATAQQRALDPGRRPDEFSTEAAGRYTREQDDYIRTTSQPLWDAFDSGPDINVQPLRMAANDVYRAMSPEERARLNDTYGSLVSEVTDWRGDVSPRAITLTLQEMKDTIAKADKMGWKEKKLQEVVDALEGTLDDPAVSQSYADAVAATREGYERFGPAFVGDVRRANRETPETLLANLGITGDRGAATIRLVGKSKIPELKDDVANYIRARAVREPNISNRFITEYEAVLDNLDPSVRREIQGLVDANTNISATESAATAASRTAERTGRNVAREQAGLERTLEQTERGLRGDIRGRYAESPNTTIDSLLTSPDGAGELKLLMDEITDLDEVASFKANVNERMENMLFDTTRDVDSGVTNSVNARANAYRNYMDVKDSLVEANVITPAEAKKMESAIERTNTEGLRKASRAYDITEQADEHVNLLASGGAAAILGPMPGAYSLMVGGAIRRSLNTLLRGKLMAKRLDALAEYLNDPKKYLADLDNLESAEAVQREFLTRLVGATQAAEIIGGDQEE